MYSYSYNVCRCSQCQTCGSTSAGAGCEWQNNYSQCGPCASYSTCPICKAHYKESESIIRCDRCSRCVRE